MRPKFSLPLAHGGDWAFVLTVAAAYASTFLAPPGSLSLAGTIGLIGLGLVYVVIGVYGFGWVGRVGSRPTALGYLVVQIFLASMVLYLSRGEGFITLIYLPLVSHSLMLLPRRWALGAIVAMILSFAAVIASFGGLRVALQAGLTVSAGVVFVAAFTEILLREQQARAEVERLAAHLAEANRKLREYAAQVEELATTKERNRLAREIHDSLGHYLTVINVQLEAAQTVMGRDPSRARDALHKAQTLAQEGLADVRRSVAALRAPPVKERPLLEAMAVLVDESRAAGISTRLSVLGDPRPLPPQTELTLYRAAQEALTNVRKHARASRADLTLDYADPAHVRLTARDDGVGATEPNGGFGLLGLRERAQLLGGEVHIQSPNEAGFALEVILPG
ncbi:MAG: histidine kinase [Anaerolineales bacterium]